MLNPVSEVSRLAGKPAKQGMQGDSVANLGQCCLANLPRLIARTAASECDHLLKSVTGTGVNLGCMGHAA
jgi:hypothetical protein